MTELTEFFSIQAGLLAGLPSSFRRFLGEKIDWKNRLIGLTGGRGTGKTTLLLQHLYDRDRDRQRNLYISADHIRVQAIGLYDIASRFFRLGGEMILIDEIHKYTGWRREIKNLYDSFGKTKIIVSGSSTLALQKGKSDLSRRIVFYDLPGLSFREYLILAHDRRYDPFTLHEILHNHPEIAVKVLKKGPILGHFKDYLDHGVYPYFLEGIDSYHHKLGNVLEKVLYEDIATGIGIKPGNVPLLKRMLWLIASSQPFKPNIDRMSSALKISKEYVYLYLDALERAELIAGIPPSETGYRLIRKPAKIYIQNTNLLHAISGSAVDADRIGSIRETFLAHQLRSASLSLRVPAMGDFVVDDKYTFEIGGKRKTKGQIKVVENSFVIKDDIEAGFGTTVPLWLFGFLY